MLDDGTPMPTMFWLIGPEWVRRIGQLEATGGVDAAEAAVDPDELAAAHARYAAVRDAKIPEGHTGPRPSGGVGGTRTGVKCLHAHWAWHLAGGDDPVGRWIAERIDATERDAVEPAALDGLHVDIRADVTVLTLPSGQHDSIPWGYATLTAAWLADADPPHPAGLTNALGTVDDHLDDVEREHPEVEQLARTERRRLVRRRHDRGAGATRTGTRRHAADRRPRSRRRRGRFPPRGHRVRSRACPQSWTTVGACRHDRRHVLRGAVGDAPVPPRAGHAADRRRRGRGHSVMRHPSLIRRPPNPRLAGRRVMLRPLTPQDFAAWRDVRLRNEDWLLPWEPLRPAGMADPARDRSAFDARCAARDRERSADHAYPFGVFVDDQLAGEVNLNNVTRGALQGATVGYWIDRERAGQAYIAEAVVVLMRFAFEQLQLHRLEICIVPRNTNSRRVVEKLDIRCEGLAERFLEINGVWEDHLRFAITVEEWQARADELTARWLTG